MSRLFYGSICITDLMQHGTEKHSAFVKGSNGKIYCNVQIWLNDEPDKYGNSMGIKLGATKEAIEKDEEQGKIYIGNCKESENVSKPLSDKDASVFDGFANDLPF